MKNKIIILNSSEVIGRILAEQLVGFGHDAISTTDVGQAFKRLSDQEVVGFICSFNWRILGMWGSDIILQAKAERPDLIYILYSLALGFVEEEAKRVGAHFVPREPDEFPSVGMKDVGRIASLLRP